MTVELRPLGVQCNIGCQYCYQNPQRIAGNVKRSYQMELMKSAIQMEGGPFTLFGGEPLLLPENDLEELWSWGFKQFGSNQLQTNGTLINDNHLRMFRQYRVSVGISVDGPGGLNDLRSAGTPTATREATRKTELAIERLCQEGVPPSLILTLHRENAVGERLTVLHEWLRYLERLGVISVRLHILEVDSVAVRDKHTLSARENIKAFLSFAALERELRTLRFDVFREIRGLLVGRDRRSSCVWSACDPYTTPAVRGVEGSGQRSNCGRTNKDGVDFSKSDTPGFERYLALYQTPQENGGCRACRFFLMCKGQCPGTAIDGDWRNRSEYCEVWKALFQYFEDQLQKEGITPISIHPIRTLLEREFVSAWVDGRQQYMETLLASK
ncbi:MAG TPA: radical SAM protein [Blastocatellia bacterium]|nr:radical SAM protein [Blastocatellia bacterium]